MKNITYALMVIVAATAACSDDDDTASTASPTTASGTREVERVDIVADQSGALTRDEELVNAWGLAFNPRGAAWVSSTEEGLSKVYDSSGEEVIPAVTIPGPDGAVTASPTGQVYNEDEDAFRGDAFIFVTEEGTLAGWQQEDGDTAEQRVDNSNSKANYKGVAIAHAANGDAQLYAADFAGAKIDVFDADYKPVEASGGFSDRDIPSGFAPFNVEEVSGALVVTYAKQDKDKEDDVRGKGNGYVNLFDSDGTLLSRLISKGELNSPWGVVLAPHSFDAAPGRLLVGNFGDGLIHVYTIEQSDGGAPSVELEGTLEDKNGNDLKIDGLWALEFGVDAGGFDANTLYFTAGPDDESHGVFGALESSEAGDGSTTSTGDSGTTGMGVSPY